MSQPTTTLKAEYTIKKHRWLVDDEPVHAGMTLEMQGVVVVGHDDNHQPRMGPGEWFTVRIESRDGGGVLDAYAQVHGVTFCARRIAGFDGDEPFSVFGLRWAGTSIEG